MESLLQFVIAHWLPCLLFLLILLLITYEETKGRWGWHQKVPALLPEEVIDLINHQNAVVIDIRNELLFKEGHIVGAVNLPDTVIDSKINTLDRYRENPIILVSSEGKACIMLAERLQKRGFPNVNTLSGGIAAWQQAKLPLKGG